MIVVASFTSDAGSDMSKRMRISAREVGLQVDVHRLPEAGSFEKNGAMKPHFAKQMLDVHGQDIVVVDVDAIFRSSPERFLKPDFAEDVALFFGGNGKPSADTLFLKNTRKARSFLSQWARIIEVRGGSESFGSLVAVTTKPRLVPIYHLGPEYCWVERVMRPHYPGAKPVIEFYSKGD
jgi:hypothetical protein